MPRFIDRIRKLLFGKTRPIRNRPTLLTLESLERRDLLSATVTPGFTTPPSAPDLFVVNSGSVTGNKVVTGTPAYSSSYALANMFDGATAPKQDPGGNTIFQDGGPAGSTDSVLFRTSNPLLLSGYQIMLGQDGLTNADRSATALRLFASSDGINYTLISSADNLSSSSVQAGTGNTGYAYDSGNNWITVADSFSAPVSAQFFRLELDQAASTGVRVFEFDGFGSVATTGRPRAPTSSTPTPTRWPTAINRRA